MTQQPDPAAMPPTRPEISERVLFDGSPSWMGRSKWFAMTWLLAAVLVVTPIALQIWAVDVPWWVIASGVVLGIIAVVLQWAFHRTIRYRITNYRIDFERGLLTRRIDSLELWHADDLYFRQNLLERIFGLGTIDVLSDDQSTPRLQIRAIPGARGMFDQIKLAVLNAKRHRGLLHLDQ